MATFWHDLRYGLRVLAKAPGFTVVAVLTLALGIGADTAIFTVVYGVLLRPLSFPHPERLLQLAESYKQLTDEMSLTATELRHLQQYGQLFEGITGFTEVGYNLATGNGADHLVGMPVSSEYFRVLGIQPELGRDFLDEDDQGNGQRMAIISHALWVRRFGADPAKIGQTILLNGEPFTLIGIMPRAFSPLGQGGAPDPAAPDVWTPLALVAKTAGSGWNIKIETQFHPQNSLDADNSRCSVGNTRKTDRTPLRASYSHAKANSADLLAARNAALARISHRLPAQTPAVCDWDCSRHWTHARSQYRRR